MRAFWITTAALFAIDQISKWAVVFALDLQTRIFIPVWPPFLTFQMGWNRGVNFGLFAHDSDIMRWVLILLSIAISAWVIRWMRGQNCLPVYISAGALVGGAMGNVIDRILYGAVADFLNMSCCGIDNPYVFNVADIAIFAGAAGMVWYSKPA